MASGLSTRMATVHSVGWLCGAFFGQQLVQQGIGLLLLCHLPATGHHDLVQSRMIRGP